MSKIETFRAYLAAMREGRLGDAAVLKADCFVGGGASAEIERALRSLGNLPDVDPAPLRALPRGTLGREYVELLDANGLQPFRLSDAIDDELVARNIFVARYSLVHDVFHVLTGFDTSWAGELGVWAFVAAQRYTAGHWIAVGMACVLYPLIAPRQIPRLWHNLRRGVSMGRRAACLLTVPFEQQWTRSVVELRRELGIDAVHEIPALVAEPAAA